MTDRIDYVQRIESIPTYSPPLHSETTNRRLVEAALGAGIEVVEGVIAPGGTADKHLHRREWQIILLLEGEGELTLGDGEPQKITAGSVVRIPPGLAHLFVVTGDRPARVIVIYSPPLGADGFVSA